MARGRDRGADQRRRHPRPHTVAAGADVRGPGDARRLSVDHRGGLRHLDDLLDASRRSDDRGGAAGRPGEGDRHGVAGRRPHGRTRRGARGPRDRGVLLRRGPGGRGDHRAADRVPDRHRDRDRARLPDLPRRHHAEPGQVLHRHRRPADLRGGGHPRLRRPRPAGGRDHPRPQHPGLRRERRDPGRLLVWRAAQGHLQLLAADHRGRGRRVGALRRDRADAVPASLPQARLRLRAGGHLRDLGRDLGRLSRLPPTAPDLCPTNPPLPTRTTRAPRRAPSGGERCPAGPSPPSPVRHWR